MFYIGWIVLAISAGKRVGLWDYDLLKATVLWIFLTGFVLVIGLQDAIHKPGFFRETTIKALGIAALLEFLVAFKSFPLWFEIPAQALAFLFAVVGLVGAKEPRFVAARKIANGYLGLFGLSALIWSAVHLVTNWSQLDHDRILREFFIPGWLTVFALMFVYGLAVVAAYQKTFLHLSWKAERSLAKQKLAVLLRVNIRLAMLRLLAGFRSARIARTHTFRQAWREIGAIRHDVQERLEEEAAAKRRLFDNAGLVGTDESGRQLDQREFQETRQALMWLATCHMGHPRNQGRYRSDLLPIVEDHFLRDGLPKQHGVEMRVDGDGRRWYATRQTISGWWFAVGAAGPPADQWLYDGPVPPKDYPAEPEWDRFGGGGASINWD